MEFCDAGSCSKIMNKMGKAFRENEIASVLFQTLLGLEYLANAKKIHRDIKADNILLKRTGESKIGTIVQHAFILLFLIVWLMLYNS